MPRTQFEQVVEIIREQARNKADVGNRFERLMCRWLRSDPAYYAQEVDEVWLWSDFPYRYQISAHDIGIDIVVRSLDGEFWAVQCKCYDRLTPIDKADVDTFMSASSKVFSVDGETTRFTRRIWIDTTEGNFTSHAEESLRNQNPPVTRIGLGNLRDAPVNWDKLLRGEDGTAARAPKYEPREHQQEAIDRAIEHYTEKGERRGKLIMACGTGKTFTSLRIAEKLMEQTTAPTVLFLVPSIALLGQSLKEWKAQAMKPIHAVCVCSDEKVSKLGEDDITGSLIDLPAPATTNAREIRDNIIKARNAQKKDGGLVVVFSTYQSTEAVSKTQTALISAGYPAVFDLIICDEAHRTTGATKNKKERTDFMLVHDDEKINGHMRMYMTATPRVYNPETVEKKKQTEKDIYLCDMNDTVTYGEQFYCINFAEAVEKGLLTDYKVVVLTVGKDKLVPVDEDVKMMGDSYRIGETVYKNPFDVPVEEVLLKLKGCINALSKQTKETAIFTAQDPGPMRSAVAFCRSIAQSKATVQLVDACTKHLDNTLEGEAKQNTVRLEARHVDGTMSAPERDENLIWLKAVDKSEDSRDSHVLCNVRCLSEGVDVPSLDAILFLSRRKNQIEVVQSVGRVMRRAPGKKYGYIIIPVIVNDAITADAAVKDSPDFSTVWSVINALRSHDKRVDAWVASLEVKQKREKHGPKLPITDPPIKPDPPIAPPLTPPLPPEVPPVIIDPIDIQEGLSSEEFKREIYATIALKCGDRKYWEHWALDVAKISKKHIGKIKDILTNDEEVRVEFVKFVAELRKCINGGITEEDAVSLISQHYVTRPVFDCLFGQTAFAAQNPVSRAMTAMSETIETHMDDTELKKDLEGFYKDLEISISPAIRKGRGLDAYQSRQDVIRELYDKFFKGAFPLTVEKLGIVYTPVEVVDFILKSCDDVLRKHFGKSLQSENVHIEDPFTGTGTFITRLLHRFTDPDALSRKYSGEIWANEIVLLAYYIAAVNIENEYIQMAERLGSASEYLPFPGICFADTFAASEKHEERRTKGEIIYGLDGFAENYERLERQQNTPLTVIIGNPPYSVGQKSANDNAANTKYEHLDTRIAETYAAGTNATNKNSLYDSYIKAFRWASDRLEGRSGVIGFVTNAGWLDGNGMNGMRKCIEEEFSEVYVFNLRGDARTQGERRKKERDNVFGQGTRTPVAVVILVKDSTHEGKAVIHYVQADDYMTREEKLAFVKETKSVLSEAYARREKILEPDEHGDWLAQRSGKFGDYFPLGDKKKNGEKFTFFEPMYSRGVATGRDAWCWNFSKDLLEVNIRRSIDFYNEESDRYIKAFPNRAGRPEPLDFVTNDSTRFVWGRGNRNDMRLGKKYVFDHGDIREAAYRPFVKQHMYLSRELNDMVYLMLQLFPTADTENLVIAVSGINGKKDFSTMIFNHMPDLNSFAAGAQCFPRYIYDRLDGQGMLFDEDEETRTRRDGITDAILKRAREKYGPDVTKDDIFYYVYGLLHSPTYAEKFAADLTKMLPRLPLVADREKFRTFAEAGRKLAALHLNYEHQPKLDCVQVIGNTSDCIVTKMRWAKRREEMDKTTVVVNDGLKVTGIPEAVERYVVNGRSPVGWLIDQYQVSVDKASGIRNDPNDWGKEHGNPRYVLDLLLSVITVAVKTMEIVDALPEVDWDKE